VEIGYSVAEGWRGLGLATELVAALVERAVREGSVRRVIARARPDNVASISVLRKNGFCEVASSESDLLRFEYQSPGTRKG